MSKGQVTESASVSKALVKGQTDQSILSAGQNTVLCVIPYVTGKGLWGVLKQRANTQKGHG